MAFVREGWQDRLEREIVEQSRVCARLQHRYGGGSTEHNMAMARRNGLMQAYALVTGEELEVVSERMLDLYINSL